MNALEMYAVFDHPSDYPSHFVVRHIVIPPGSPPMPGDCQLAESLAEARDFIPHGLVNIGRQPEDDPKIVEVWV